jgi:hypothetical protein
MLPALVVHAGMAMGGGVAVAVRWRGGVVIFEFFAMDFGHHNLVRVWMCRGCVISYQ